MKILLGHSFPDRASFGSAWTEGWLRRLRLAGFDVHPVSLVIDQNRPVVYFEELDILWRYHDRRLLELYERLEKRLMDFDAFICFNGANVHPEFARDLNCITVYACFDDPEASEKLSKPVAGAFDVVMVGNIAEVPTYRGWGVKNVHWWPLGFRNDDYNPALTKEDILSGSRDIDLVLLCERLTGYRKNRVDQFVRAFPAGRYYGLGWPAGFLPEGERIPLLQSARIGINIHNSTGPINFRTFYLPANGVLQICDNKSHLGKIFKLGEEAIGYDSIDEAVELAHYYLQHDDVRRQIAASGWARAIADYNEVACFQRVVDAINDCKIVVSGKDKSRAVLDRAKEIDIFESARDRIFLFIWMGMSKFRVMTGVIIRKLLGIIS